MVCSGEQPDKAAELRARDVEVIAMADAKGKVDLPRLMSELARREINEVHVEAGFKLNGSLIRENCIDELLLYQAPCLLGQATGFANLGPVSSLAQRHQLRFVSADRVGSDLRIIARFTKADDPHQLPMPYVVDQKG